VKVQSILIAGSEFTHTRDIARMRRYLITHGHQVLSVRQTHTRFGLDWLIYSLIKSVTQADAALLMFHGHGHQAGWENGVEYHLLVNHLAKIAGKLIFINDTCYGACILPLLQEVRSFEDTCFLAPWDSEGVSYGNCVKDCLTAWQQNRRHEEVISGNILSTDVGDFEYPAQVRWGQSLDHLLFPNVTI
jgi:hypothetical protein